MAQSLLRKALTVFGLGGTTDDFEEFGSTAIAATNYTKDIEVIQDLAAWTNGWRDALIAGKAPVLQDMNAVMYVHSYLQAYLFQEGIPEYNDATTYDKGSIVKLPYTGNVGSAQIFVSLIDANVGNALPTAPASNTNWQFMYGLTGSGLVTPGRIDGASVAAGMVGQMIQTSVSSPTNFPNNNVYGDLGSLALTKGNWDVYAQIHAAQPSGGTGTFIGMGIGTASGNSSTGLVDGITFLKTAAPVFNISNTFITIRVPINISSDTTYYVKLLASYSGTNPQYAGTGYAIRLP